MSEWPGHAVLQVPTPPLEAAVRIRYERYDPTLLAADPAHVHAHVTVLGPVPAELSPVEASAVAELCRVTSPITSVLDRVATFPNGIVHVRPQDDRPWAQLTGALRLVFPGWPPYGGAHEPGPHVTVDAVGPGVTEEGIRIELAPLLPVTWTADRLELVWYRPGEVRVLRSWPFAGLTG